MPKGEERLSHLRETGEAHMISVSEKPETRRRAVAEGFLSLSSRALDLIGRGELKKGDALAVGRVAGIMGAKRVPDLIPLAHPIRITGIEVDLVLEEAGIRIEARVETADRTGVEMEAMTAVAVAGLALYDMVKGVDRSAALEGVRLLEKEGGKSGRYVRQKPGGA